MNIDKEWQWMLSKEPNPVNQYPFDEGDDYWVIEDGQVVWSCWDYISEELHDGDASRKYFNTEEQANRYINNI